MREYRISWVKLALWVIIGAILLIHPFTRQIVWFVLPIGAKPDDLAFIGAVVLVLGIVILTIRGYINRNIVMDIFATLFLKSKRKNEDLFDSDEEM